MAAFDAKKLSQVDWVVAGAGLLAFIALFLPWYGVSDAFFSASVNGWSTSYGWLGALLMIAAGAYLVLQRSQVDLSKMPVGPGVVVLGASALGTLIVILRWLTLPSGGGSLGIGSYSYGPRIGIYLALLAGVVQAGCSFKLFKESGEALPWAGRSSPATYPQSGPMTQSGSVPQPGPMPQPDAPYSGTTAAFTEAGVPSPEPSSFTPSEGGSMPQAEPMPPDDSSSEPIA